MMRATYLMKMTVCILTMSALMLAGCDKKPEERKAEKITEQMLKGVMGKDVDVDIKGKNIKIEGQDSKVEISETNIWPPDMFEDVPQFTSGRIEHVTKTQEGGTQSFNIFFADIRGDVLKEYDAELKGRGWQTQLMDMGKGGMISAQKDKLGLNFSSSQDDNKGILAVFSTQ